MVLLIWFAVFPHTLILDYSKASQGLIRALEEYEIPIDHIAGIY